MEEPVKIDVRGRKLKTIEMIALLILLPFAIILAGLLVLFCALLVLSVCLFVISFVSSGIISALGGAICIGIGVGKFFDTFMGGMALIGFGIALIGFGCIVLTFSYWVIRTYVPKAINRTYYYGRKGEKNE